MYTRTTLSQSHPRSAACAAGLAALLNVPCDRNTAKAPPFLVVDSVGVKEMVEACAAMVADSLEAAIAASLVLSCLCSLCSFDGVRPTECAYVECR